MTLTSSVGYREDCNRTRVTSLPNGADLQAVGIRSAVKVGKGDITTSSCVVCRDDRSLPRGVTHGLGVGMYVRVRGLAFIPFTEYTWSNHITETALTDYDRDCVAGVLEAKSKRKIAVIGDRCVDEVYC